ncbi:glycoside hydrolase family 18 protein [Gautieria morchelliformis]|nr:glycoside hydrolase family 18 protein [Gautieria morchelliformis]
MHLLPVLLAAAVSASPLAHRLVERATPGSSLDTNTSTGAPDFVASTWFAGWHATSGFAVSNISWDKYTHIKYAFATTKPDVNTIDISQEDQTIIPEFVSAAHSNGVPASISVGGWTGSQYFSTAVATAQNRTAFVKTLSDFVAKWGFDGIDFDWEYPNNQGVGCNIISPTDTANFLLLLQELRSTPSTCKLILSAATSNAPFVDSTGSPSSDVSAFAKVLDFIEIMNYDIWGSWSTAVGPNAPLDDSCAPAADQQGSAMKAVAAWTQAGFPAQKIVLGVASYGHSYSVANTDAVQNGALVPYPPFNKANQPHGDSWDGAAGPDVCGVQQPVGGIFNFWGLIQGGFLTSTGKPASGITYRFDNCSQTAYVYNPATQVEVSFDDATAFAAKGSFIKSTSLRGFSLWEAGGDSHNILLNAILASSGAPTCLYKP